MAVKMRNNYNEGAVCCECGDAQNKVLNMFDLHIGGITFTICDVCNKKLLHKCLSAECMKNGRLKSQQDIAIIHRRKSREMAIKKELGGSLNDRLQ